jgi:predicted nucleic acid-binding protein
VKLAVALEGIRRLYIDTAPVIYHVEANPKYLGLTRRIFHLVKSGTILAVASPVTLAECLVHPYRSGDQELIERFRNTVTAARNTLYISIDDVAEHAAELEARYALDLPDSFQLAAALAAECNAILTNDREMKRVTEIRVLVLDELEV